MMKGMSSNKSMTGRISILLAVAVLSAAFMIPIPSVHAAGFTYTPVNPLVGQQITFTASSSCCNLFWAFGDGATAANNQVVYHTYTAARPYSVTLRSTDSNGNILPPVSQTLDITCVYLGTNTNIPVSGDAVNSVVNTGFDSSLGQMFSEAKVDAGLSTACTHTIYGGNKPGIFMGLIAALTSDATGSKCDVTYTSCSINNFQWLKTEIRITDSSGAVFSPKPDSNGHGGVATSVWDTPHSSGDPDDLKILNDIVVWAVATYANIPMPPDIKIPVNLPNGWSYSSDGTTLVGQFTDYADNTIGPYHSISDKGLKLKITPDFQKPDLYTVTITMSARRGIC